MNYFAPCRNASAAVAAWRRLVDAGSAVHASITAANSGSSSHSRTHASDSTGKQASSAGFIIQMSGVRVHPLALREDVPKGHFEMSRGRLLDVSLAGHGRGDARTANVQCSLSIHRERAGLSAHCCRHPVAYLSHPYNLRSSDAREAAHPTENAGTKISKRA